MGLTHGPRIIGQKAYDAAVKAEEEMVATHGSAEAKYGPRVLGKKAGQPEEPTADEEFTVAQIAEMVGKDPALVVELYIAELERDGGPRKGVFKALKAAEAQKPTPDTDVLAALDAALADT